jgi:diacylglycerol kinase family enzyme
MIARRLWALAAVALAGASVALAAVIAINRFPRGLAVVACLVLAASAASYAVRRRGRARQVAGAAAALSFAGVVALILVDGRLGADLLLVAAIAGSVLAARIAFRAHVRLPPAPAPRHPVLIFNPKSGGGKAVRFNLAQEAQRRGFDVVELRPGDDLEELARAAVQRGGDALAMAGGDGSQAIVASVASELDLPYACIPAGTRNHFALDLGVERSDVIGALDAFVDGGERQVDLADVNGRVFVNNVSLGLYADAVQRPEYRGAKLHTLLALAPDVIGPDAKPPHFDWAGRDGRESGVGILVSNNRYRLGRPLGAGTRPRLDGGVLGIAVVGSANGTGQAHDPRSAIKWWTDRSFAIDSAEPVAAGIDGEAARLDPPLRFHIRPAALRVRVAPNHPGASPSALAPDSATGTIVALLRIAFAGETPHGSGG